MHFVSKQMTCLYAYLSLLWIMGGGVCACGISNTILHGVVVLDHDEQALVICNGILYHTQIKTHSALNTFQPSPKLWLDTIWSHERRFGASCYKCWRCIHSCLMVAL